MKRPGRGRLPLLRRLAARPAERQRPGQPGRPRLLPAPGRRGARPRDRRRRPRSTTGTCPRRSRTTAAGPCATPPSASPSTADPRGEAMGDGVGRWITLNEPGARRGWGTGSGVHAPGIEPTRPGRRGPPPPAATPTAEATDVLRAGRPTCRSGYRSTWPPSMPASDHRTDVAATRRRRRQPQPALPGPAVQGGVPSRHARASRRPGAPSCRRARATWPSSAGRSTSWGSTTTARRRGRWGRLQRGAGGRVRVPSGQPGRSSPDDVGGRPGRADGG